MRNQRLLLTRKSRKHSRSWAQNLLGTSRQVSVVNKCFTVPPNICRSPIWHLLYVNFLTLRILKRLLEFWIICAPLNYVLIHVYYESRTRRDSTLNINLQLDMTQYYYHPPSIVTATISAINVKLFTVFLIYHLRRSKKPCNPKDVVNSGLCDCNP